MAIQIIERQTNVYTMDIPERDAIIHAMEEYCKDRNNNDKAQAFRYSFYIYLNWLKNYAQTELKGQAFSVDDIVSIVFNTRLKENKQNKEKFYKYSLYILGVYAEYLIENPASVEHIGRYETLIFNLLSEEESVLAGYEGLRLNDNKCIECTVGSRKSIMPDEILRACNQIFHLEEVTDIETLDFRNIKPYMVFNIRQLLERVGENIIGYTNITNAKGKPIHKFTQIAWSFLEEREGKGVWILQLPYKAKTINRINQWTNTFVHPANIMHYYLQFFALFIVRNLMKQPAQMVQIYNGRKRLSIEYGDFRIEHYNNLKSDFEKYIADKMNEKNACYKRVLDSLSCKKRKKNFQIHWKNLDKVGAYIISL